MLTALLGRVDALKTELAGLRPFSHGELLRFREEFMIENTYDSNAIEGSTLTLRETALILKEGITIAEKPLVMHLDAVGHRDAFEYMLAAADANTSLSERTIRELHALVYTNDAKNKGAYRNIPVKISGAANTPHPHYLVAPQMEALIAECENLKRDGHIIKAIAEFHLRYEGIHPFIDGNGRTGRLIINLELIKAGLLPVNIKFADRRKYYDCFDKYYGTNGTSDALTELIAGYEVTELEKYIEISKRCLR